MFSMAYILLGEGMKFQVAKPYPQIRVERKSLKTAKIISHLYASNESELTAVHEYMFQSMVTLDEEVKLILHSIGIVEMKHLEILGSILNTLGSPPVYADIMDDDCSYWNSDFVYYDQDLKTILEIDIEREKQAIYNYHMVLSVLDDIYIKECLKRIVEDEYLHLEILEKLLLQVIK